VEWVSIKRAATGRPFDEKKIYMLRLHQLAQSKLIVDAFRKLWLTKDKRKQSLFPADGINTIDLTANLQPFDKRSLTKQSRK